MNRRLVSALIFSFASLGFSEDFKTVNRKEYKDATVTRVEPDGIVVKTKSGVTKVYFTELPKDVQERFHYDSEKAASYSAEQAANYTAYQKQQEETRRQQAEADARNNAALAEQQAATNRTQALQARYGELQRQENDLLHQTATRAASGAEWRAKARRILRVNASPPRGPITCPPSPSQPRCFLGRLKPTATP